MKKGFFGNKDNKQREVLAHTSPCTPLLNYFVTDCVRKRINSLKCAADCPDNFIASSKSIMIIMNKTIAKTILSFSSRFAPVK
jgi:hypothetical protein